MAKTNLDRPGPIRVRLRISDELHARLKMISRLVAGGRYTSLARKYVAAGVLMDEAQTSLKEGGQLVTTEVGPLAPQNSLST